MNGAIVQPGAPIPGAAKTLYGDSRPSHQQQHAPAPTWQTAAGPQPYTVSVYASHKP